MKLSDITDYKELFKRDSINLKKIGTIAALSLGGAVVLGPLAFAGAPAIGGAVGTFLGLSGAAATNAGLALIGGGSLATGGLGMAGGATIIGASGAALGGTLGGVISNSYFGDVEGFFIKRVKPGTSPKVIFIDGFLTEKNTTLRDWKKALHYLYPNHPWYYLRWESKRLNDIGKTIGRCSPSVTAAVAQKWAKSATRQAAKQLGPISSVLFLLGLASNPWSIALVKASQTGILLADIMARTDSDYILCGHSLGARVIYYALENLSTKEKPIVRAAHLLGGAVGNNSEDWEKAVTATTEGINNYYSKNDQILATLYKAGTFFTSEPIGRNPINSVHSMILDVDVSHYVSGHTHYKKHFHNFARLLRTLPLVPC